MTLDPVHPRGSAFCRKSEQQMLKTEQHGDQIAWGVAHVQKKCTHDLTQISQDDIFAAAIHHNQRATEERQPSIRAGLLGVGVVTRCLFLTHPQT